MKNFIHHLEIKNFKSIKHLETDCKRVNVFIGMPNVGKSNILEAIGLLGAHYSMSDSKVLGEFVRYEEPSNLFYDDDVRKRIEVNTNLASAVFLENSDDRMSLIIGKPAMIEEVISNGKALNDSFRDSANNSIPGEPIFPFYVELQSKGQILNRIGSHHFIDASPVKQYNFRKGGSINDPFPHFLKPPFGQNLFNIVFHDKELRKELADIIIQYGFQFAYTPKDRKIEIEKNIGGDVTKYHFSSLADTFQRLIFYYAAIDSNKESILVLEEPEVHSYPPYTKNLAERIVDSKENQFFITTHSPYILQNLISELGFEELNVFVTYFEDYETKVKRLSEEELRHASGHGRDLFFNLSQFLPQ